MPTMRDMALLCLPERLVEVVDHRAQVRPHRQRFLEGGDHADALGCTAAVPRLGEGSHQAHLFPPVARHQPLALDNERLSRFRGEPSRSEEHTSELQSLAYLVCRLLL